MFYWDGNRWTHEPGTEPSRRSARHPIRDWVATAIMLVGICGVVLPRSNIDAASPALTLTPSTAPAGAVVTVVGSGFQRQARVQLTFDGAVEGMPVGKVSGQGQFRARITVPQVAAGSHRIAAVSLTDPSGGQASAVVAGLLLTSVLLTVSPAEAEATPPASSSPPATVAASPSPSPATPSQSAAPSSVPTASAKPLPTPVPPDATPAPTVTPAPVVSAPRLLFGLGPQVDGAAVARLTQEAPVHLLSAWYNGPQDLGWITDGYHQSMFDQQYAAGRSLHLIVWTGDAESTVSTSYGAACGRPYPLSDRFLGDMQQLAAAFAGSGTLYVTLFTEFQTYPCTDNAWNPSAAVNNYYRALKDRYVAARSVIRQNAPNARVSLGWGGWQTRWDDPASGGGWSMFGYFADVMSASDFQSFQAMQSDGNVVDIAAMVNVLNDYGPVMLAHYKPDNGSQLTYDADLAAMLTDAYLTQMTGAGLFAWSFMDSANLAASETSYQFVKAAVQRYGR